MDNRGKTYIISLVALLTLALILGGKLPYTLFFIVLWAGIISVGTTMISARDLDTLYTIGQTEVNVEDHNTIRMQVYNRSTFSIPYLYIVQRLPKRLSSRTEIEDLAVVKSKEDTILWNEFLCKRRGVYRLGELELSIRDILGIVNIKRTVQATKTLIVYPRLIKLEHLNLPSNRQMGNLPSLNKSLEDFSTILDLRKYNYGDSLKKVHWKLTAKKGELFVKNFEYKASTGIWIFLDLFEDSYDKDEDGSLEEWAVEACLAIAYYGLRNRMTVNLVCYGEDRTKIEGSEVSKIDSFIKSMIDVTAVGKTHIADILTGEGRFAPWGSTIIAITPNVDSKVYSAYCSLKKLGYRGSVVNIGAGLRGITHRDDIERNCEFLVASGIPVFNIHKGDDIKPVLEG